jgi:hypothetical protein
MPISDRDIEAWAARIRPHFEPPLQDLAEHAAIVFAPIVGPRIKFLRPETSMADMLRWVTEAQVDSHSPIKDVELLMAAEGEVDSKMPDAFAQNIGDRTFREFVEHLRANNRGLTMRWSGP